ncbi:MAG: hypothetical protein GXP28_11400 [Planctomycetes bacterium]|nr:hypothetical protein [Planctomycetota bacterium]
MHTIFFTRLSKQTAFVLVLLLACASIVLLSCKQQQEPNFDLSMLKKNTIIPGVGVKGCIAGMRTKDLGERWTRVVGGFCESSRGIVAIEKNERVLHVLFVFDSNDDWGDFEVAFSGGTREGITSTSSIEDVILTYGQPTSISAVFRFERRERHVGLMYPEKGIDFRFLEDKLHRVYVYEATFDYDPQFFTDIGDVSKYRAIKPDNSP